MFQSARLKLTVWYLLVIMLISFIFSIVIYREVNSELRRRFVNIENRLKLEQKVPKIIQSGPKPFFIEDLIAARRRVMLLLLFSNGTILIISAAAGYFLAGKTLRPIEEMLKTQNRFIADASHELRTPLSAVKTSTEVALRNKKLSTAEAKNILKDNLKDIDSLQKLTDSLLSLAQYQSGESNYNLQQTDIKEVIENTIRKIRPMADKKNISISLKAKHHYLESDEIGLEEMMLIFLDNAVKYTPEGGEIKIEAKADLRQVTIKIKDTGIGISSKNISRIFERFYQVETARSKNKGSGFGLGLPLAKKIIDFHKGTITVSSRLQKGSIFTIKFPFRNS